MFRRTPGFDTLAVHAGAQASPANALSGFETTTAIGAGLASQAFADSAQSALLEERMAALEGGTAAVAAASGDAARLLVFHTLLQPGDNFIAPNALNDGTTRQFSHAFRNFNWQVRWADPANIANYEAAIDDKTRAIFIESLASPGGIFVDIEQVAEIAHRHGLPLIVDNTMASPWLLRPIEHGADIVVHSLNRFIVGHGNLTGGIIIDCGTFDWSKSGHYPLLSQPRPEYDGMVLHDSFGNQAFAIACRASGLHDLGLLLSPCNALLIASELETLPLRMQRRCDNALKVAEWLQRHDKVAWVSYPGLEGDPNHALQQKYAPQGAGAACSFGLKGGFEAAIATVEAVEIFSQGSNISDVRSSIIHPATITQRHLSGAENNVANAGSDMMHLSIGIEDVADILADLEQALAKNTD